MAATLSPNPTIQKRRTSISTRLQSPKSPFVIGSNDDKLERAQARAARAAAIRRRIVEDDVDIPSSPSNSCLDGAQIMDLFRNCIKLASENKINQKNTWELKLIDHLSELIKVEDEEDAETNFQKASCTLEAGVKIYAHRVDSVHSEAYKVLGGISRAGLEEQQETSAGGDNDNNEQDVNQPKKDSERKLSPLSTLESSFEALNVKKFDVSFAVDPLYHQTTAQFDEGGAKGLLLNNLGIYGGCRVLFDSQEVPAKCISSISDTNSSNLIDVSFAGDCIEQMKMNVKKDICPTLSAIVEQLDEYSLQQRQCHSSQDCVSDVDATDGMPCELNGDSEFTSLNTADDNNGCELDDGSYDNAEACSFDHHDDAYHPDDNFDVSDQHLGNYYEVQETHTSSESDIYDRFDNVASLLLEVSGITSSQNAWAGPEHWKFRKSKTGGTEGVTAQDTELGAGAKRQKTNRASEADINLTKALDKDLPDIFAPPKKLNSLQLPAKKVPCSNKLPEDCHYQPENLVKLFLLPNVMCLGKRRRTADNGSWQEGSDINGSFDAWDNENAYSGPDNDDYAHSDRDEQDILVSKPRQVSKIEVQYDKTAKQVDVHLLKETLWDHLHGSVQAPEVRVEEDAISFKQVLASFPNDCGAAPAHDISPHLCFICLLHLANEHGLRIQGCTNMDDLNIHLPVSS